VERGEAAREPWDSVQENDAAPEGRYEGCCRTPQLMVGFAPALRGGGDLLGSFPTVPLRFTVG
jgi:hypothetical protein